MPFEKIPKIDFPLVTNFDIDVHDEPLVSLSEMGFLCEPYYYNKGIPGALNDCYARKTVAEMLRIAEDSLPDGLKFKIYDAYRPIEVQQHLWDKCRADIERNHPELSESEIDKKTSFFVSKPSYDASLPSLHNTGGAVDLTLVTMSGFALNMGTLFDDFTNRAWTNHFEAYESCEEVRTNRRVLYYAMINVGFTNFPSEWWHYDYGTKFWGYFKNRNALYNGILDAKL